ncbi:MAG: 3' terminal RNA ribose 2'-O-methyltransferase Hen1 [Deltaproteobacteria bacterium]|nr:3' terminal RNA ribose 2'-O-methyltransferase Hen1 [Deltaproteobacteria bacterium]
MSALRNDEVQKLVRRGGAWLRTHPEREVIANRYLKHQRSLARRALEQLIVEDAPDADEVAVSHAQEEAEIETRISLNDQRIGAVLAALRQSGAKRVLDVGCGEGQLLRALLKDKSFEEIVGVDVSHRSLEIAADRLRLDAMPARQRNRVKLVQGSITYRDERLSGYDAAACVEVIEHLDPPRRAAFERSMFEHARPCTVIVTTPNHEYNVKLEGLPAGRFRHKDHRFEWSRVEFELWARGVASRFGYGLRVLPVGPVDEILGPPTQMGVFTR